MLKGIMKPGRSATDARSGPVLRPEDSLALHALDRFGLGLTLIRNQRPQLFAGLEDGNRTRSDFDRIAGAGIARHAGLPPADLEGAESAHLDVVLPLERVLDGLEESIDDSGAVLLGDHRT